MNYWFKILESEETRFIKTAYQLLLNDIANKPNCVNWVSNTPARVVPYLSLHF